MGPEYCTECGEELEEGQIGICEDCRGDDEDEEYYEDEGGDEAQARVESALSQDEEPEEEPGEHIVVELKHARARIFLKELPEGFGYSYDFEYRCGNHSGQIGSITPPCTLFPSAQDSFIAALQHGLGHFDPEKLPPYDSCVCDAQRAVAVEMTARHLAMRGVFCALRSSNPIPAPVPENELQPSLF
jgi:hypothetical protein